jgi:hypothetical protein
MINIQKAVAFLYTNNEQNEKEINQENNSFTVVPPPKKKKKLGINLGKEMKDIYNKNYKSLKTSEDGKLSDAQGLAELIL